jgi:sporulation protein YlmC with PRC-barrel domain
MTRIDRKPTLTLAGVAAALAVAFAAVPVQAQDRNADRANTPAQQNRTAAPPAQKNTAALHEARLSKLIGIDVHNAAGKDIGEINDVIIDANNGRVHYAVLAFGGFMGMGEKLFAYPLTSFKLSDRDNRMILDVSEDKLKSSPGFERNKWPDWNDATYRGEIDQRYGVKDERVGTARFVRGSQLLDAEVRAKGGEDIGDVEDVVVNVRNGKVSYAVIDFDPGWFADDKLVALPMQAFDTSRRDKALGNDLVVNVDKSRLQNAPAFSRNEWPDAKVFRRDVDRYSTGLGWGTVYGPEGSRDRPLSPAPSAVDQPRR